MWVSSGACARPTRTTWGVTHLCHQAVPLDGGEKDPPEGIEFITCMFVGVLEASLALGAVSLL